MSSTDRPPDPPADRPPDAFEDAAGDRRTEPFVRLDIADRIARITLDSQHNRNALSTQLISELGEALATAERSDAGKKIIDE